MRHLNLCAAAAFVIAALPLSSVQADEPDVFALTLEPAPAPRFTYEELEMRELERKALRSRNALIGTAAAAAVGLALTIPAAATQCNSVTQPDGEDDYDCSRAGDLLFGFGSPLVVGGLTGAVISGIMLGVRKGRLRRLNDRTGYLRAGSLRWDDRRGAFVF